MRIRSVRIINFRALQDVVLDFDDVTTFIGPNGSGKSTVLHALDWFFNGRVRSLTDQDCSFGNANRNIEVRVTFQTLTPRDRAELGKYTPEGASTFTAWKIRTPDGEETLSANAKGLPAFDAIKATAKATPKKELYNELRRERTDLTLPTASTGAAIDQAISNWESENVDALVDVPEVLQTDFFGFNSGGKMSGLFDFVLVTADLRADEEAQDVKSSIIGRILERSIDRSSADEAIAEIVKKSRELQQEVYNNKFKEQLSSLTHELNTVVSTYSPGRTMTVAPAEVEFKAPRTTFDVSVIDGDTKTAVERQGHGFQRTLLISALQVLAQSGAGSDEGVICLAIEEPELFQHPIQAQTFAKVLRSLAEDASKRMQVAYATHSPYFIESQNFHQVRRITRSADVTPVVSVHAATVSDVKRRLNGITKGLTVDRQLDGVVANQLSVALFANKALVVEGSTELSVFYGLGDRTSAGSLESQGVAIVPVGGKSTIPLVHAILVALGIDSYALFDGDGGFENRAMKNGKNAEAIQSERESHVSSNRTVSRYFGLPEVDFPSAKVGDTAAVFEDHLEGFLEAEWPEWKVSCDALEAASGISLKKNQLAYRKATLNAEGSVPRMLLEVLSKLTC